MLLFLELRSKCKINSKLLNNGPLYSADNLYVPDVKQTLPHTIKAMLTLTVMITREIF